ncbi:DUF1501 domain-containing protein [bacterium]|nr:DUF1501 domain-containing protein [bacterium]
MSVTSRRSFLEFGCRSIGGLSLLDVLRARLVAERTGTSVRRTSTIFVTLGGGPSQFETYDPKPDAAVEYRGNFSPISTSVPGVQFCELLPRQAALADRLTIVRSIQHQQASHIAEHIVETGYDLRSSTNARTGEMPSVGSVVSRVRAGSSSLPGYVSLPKHHAYAGPHWLGAQHRYFDVNDDPNAETFRVSNLSVSDKLDVDRLKDRRSLAQQFDRGQQIHDQSGEADSLEAVSQQAFELITGQQAQQAFDITQEPPQLRDRYGRNIVGQRMLLARRLVEAGVPFVTVRMGAWDDHEDLDSKISQRAPIFDTGITALIEDLRDRGLTQDVLVVAMGEFGRTPRINGKGGRDHWPAVNSVLISGGSYRMGQVIGATDSKASRVVEAPYQPQNVLTMIYRHLGIDPATTFPDYSGRPRYVLEERELIQELL